LVYNVQIIYVVYVSTSLSLMKLYIHFMLGHCSKKIQLSHGF